MTSSQNRRISSALLPANKVLGSVNDALVTLNAYRPIRASMAGMGVVVAQAHMAQHVPDRPAIARARRIERLVVKLMQQRVDVATSSHIIVSSLIASSPEASCGLMRRHPDYVDTAARGSPGEAVGRQAPATRSLASRQAAPAQTA